jgi:hypothetical protein
MREFAAKVPKHDPALRAAIPTAAHEQRADLTPGSVPSHVQEVLSSPGVPLDLATRAYMEPRLEATISAACAYMTTPGRPSRVPRRAAAHTVGPHIVLGARQPPPGSPSGQLVLAHELARSRTAGRADPAAPRRSLGAPHEIDAARRVMCRHPPPRGRQHGRRPGLADAGRHH